jgi:hypothetical protein
VEREIAGERGGGRGGREGGVGEIHVLRKLVDDVCMIICVLRHAAKCCMYTEMYAV